MDRRELLQLGALFLNPLLEWPVAAASRPKHVIVAGAGLAGLTCAYELWKRGHDVSVLEASSHTGGHVHTLREGLPDGLYADVGAEHFTKPGYDICWKYFEELRIDVLPYPHRENVLRLVDGRMLPEKEAFALELAKWAREGFTSQEIRYLREQPGRDFLHLYFDRYIDKIHDEYRPLGVGLDHLDELSVTQLLKDQGASAAAIRQFGADESALHAIWKLAILGLRKTDENPHALFRLKGGNQSLPDALAQKLGARIRTGSPITAIRHNSESVEVAYNTSAGSKSLKGDYLVCCMNAVVLRNIQVTPEWPEPKRYAIVNVPYTVETRPVLVAKTKFWQTDGYSGNMEFGSRLLGPLWPMAQDVPTERGLLIGTSQAGITAKTALDLFKKYYPGRPTIESSQVVDWSRDPWAMTCEARTYRPGYLRRMWPAVIAPVGRVHFAGAYCDNQSWGMEAATRTAVRTARAIHEA